MFFQICPALYEVEEFTALPLLRPHNLDFLVTLGRFSGWLPPLRFNSCTSPWLPLFHWLGLYLKSCFVFFLNLRFLILHSSRLVFQSSILTLKNSVISNFVL